MRLYRGRFMIGIYALESEGETLLALCENVRELAKALNTTEASAREKLSSVLLGKRKHVVFANKLRTLELIDMLM